MSSRDEILASVRRNLPREGDLLLRAGESGLAAGHAAIGRQDQRAGRLALRFCQVVNIAVGGIGADHLSEHLRHVCPELMHRRHDDVARIFIVELLYALA